MANPVVRLEDGTIHTDWEIPRRIFQLESFREVEQISQQSNSSSEQCLIVLFRIRKFYSNVLNYRLNELYGKFTGTFAFTRHYLINGICFESCKLQQVRPDFMESQSINWDSQHQEQQRLFGKIRKNDCIRELGILTSHVPNEMSAPIHGLIRESHRFLYDWGCCSRSKCPLEKLGAQQPAPRNRDSLVVPVRTTWNRISGPPTSETVSQKAALSFCC